MLAFLFVLFFSYLLFSWDIFILFFQVVTFEDVQKVFTLHEGEKQIALRLADGTSFGMYTVFVVRHSFLSNFLW